MKSASHDTSATSGNPELPPPGIMFLACPSCGHRLRLAHEHLGLKGNCVSCGTGIMGAETSPGKFEAVFTEQPSQSVAIETEVVSGQTSNDFGIPADEKPEPEKEKPGSQWGFSEAISRKQSQPAEPCAEKESEPEVEIPEPVATEPEPEPEPAPIAGPFSTPVKQNQFASKPGEETVAETEAAPSAPFPVEESSAEEKPPFPVDPKPTKLFDDNEEEPEETDLDTKFIPEQPFTIPLNNSVGTASTGSSAENSFSGNQFSQSPPTSGETPVAKTPFEDSKPPETATPETSSQNSFSGNQFSRTTPEPTPQTSEPAVMKTPFDDDPPTGPGDFSTDSLKNFLTEESDPDTKSLEKILFEPDETETEPKATPEDKKPTPDPVNFSEIKLKSAVPKRKKLSTIGLCSILFSISLIFGFAAFIWTPPEKKQQFKTQLSEWLAPGAVLLEKLPFTPEPSSLESTPTPGTTSVPVQLDTRSTASSALP